MYVRRGIFFALLGCVLLASCGKRSTPLPPEEVIRRTVLVSQTTDSVSFDGAASLELRDEQTLSGSIAVSGVIRNVDSTWALEASMEFVQQGGGRPVRRGSGTVALSSPLPSALFLRIDRLQGPLFPLSVASGSIRGKWWRVAGTGMTVSLGTGKTPDPRLADTYVSAVEVESGGLVLPGKDVYHYVVRVSPEALRSFLLRMTRQPVGPMPGVQGEVWIDSSTFRLRRAQWTVRSFPTRVGNLSSTVQLVLSEYDRAPEILQPPASGSALPLDTIFDIFSPSSPVSQPGASMDTRDEA